MSRRPDAPVYALASNRRPGVQGFEMVAFPCNQFAGQAPGSSEEERQYAFRKFGFEFPIMVGNLLIAGSVRFFFFFFSWILCSSNSSTRRTLDQGPV